MKRYFKTITAVVLAVLAVAACQKENLGEVAPDGREAEVKLTLTSPQIGTKSYADVRPSTRYSSMCISRTLPET